MIGEEWWKLQTEGIRIPTTVAGWRRLWRLWRGEAQGRGWTLLDVKRELESLRAYVNTLEDENAALLAEVGPYRGKCHACNVEAALGTEECPHPVDRRVHTCDRTIEVDSSCTLKPQPRTLLCGCVACVCEDPVQCHGCGARMCQEHARRGS
jgi:hypothetical protein